VEQQVNERAKEILVNGARELGVKLSTADLGKFYKLAAELKKWAGKINLTTIRDDEDIAIKHFLDSLTLVRMVGARGDLLDIGSGGGFPSIPLKIIYHDLHVVAVDAVEKKVIFQRHAARQLGLRHFESLHSRAEELAARFSSRFDWVVSRAFADIPTFVRFALPLIKEEGRIIAMKGRGGREEAAVTEASLHDMGVVVDEIVDLRLPVSGDSRTLIVMKKSLPPKVVT
jgi:16S rRNA (guanine527-N7)-methyltransferase